MEEKRKIWCRLSAWISGTKEEMDALLKDGNIGNIIERGDFELEEITELIVVGEYQITGKKKERKEWNHPRTFTKSERVVYEDKNGTPHKAMLTYDQVSKYEDDKIEIFIFHDEEDDDSQGIEMKFVDAKNVYQLSEHGKTCPKCGESLYDEHLEHMDYPYYCPWCQENFYGIEVQ